MGGANGAQGVANDLNRGEVSLGSTGPIVKTATATLEPYERFVHGNHASVAMTFTMPSAGAVQPGAIFIIRQIDTSANVTIAFPGGADDPSDISLTTAVDQACMVSDGQQWYTLSSIVT